MKITTKNFYLTIIHYFKKSKYFIFLFACFFILAPESVSAESRLVNFHFGWHIDKEDVEKLAKWDVLVLDMEVQINSFDKMRQIKKKNPDIIFLAYISSQEINVPKIRKQSIMRQVLASGVSDKWYLKDKSGKKIQYWPGTYMMNITQNSPKAKGKRWNSHLAKFVSKSILKHDTWDGVFYDSTWEGVHWFTGDKVDSNLDRKGDGKQIDKDWKKGMEELFRLTRKYAKRDVILVGNGYSPNLSAKLNGIVVENFPAFDNWSYSMDLYEKSESHRGERFTLINSNSNNTGNRKDYKEMRFGYASTLLEDGYYSFDAGDQSHNETWWYDEYDVELGDPISKAKSLKGFTEYKPDVWIREYENGIAIVNSSPNKRFVSLEGEYEKIFGTQDKKTNNGAIVHSVVLKAGDGIILKKLHQRLDDVFLSNGSFVRFYSPEGKKHQNGFFVYRSDYDGGNLLGNIDLDGRGAKDFLVQKGNKIYAYKDSGSRYMKRYPYSANYKGSFDVKVGDLQGKKTKKELLLLPPERSSLPVKVITYYNQELKGDWYPFGKYFRGRYLATIYNSEAIFARKVGRSTRIEFFKDYKKTRSFSLPFTAEAIHAGDFDNDGKGDLAVASKSQGKLYISIFDLSNGKQKSRKFSVTNLGFSENIDLSSFDMDRDGKEEILIINK